MIRRHWPLSIFDEFNLMTVCILKNVSKYHRFIDNDEVILRICSYFLWRLSVETTVWVLTKLIKTNQRYFDISSDNRIEWICQTQTNTLRIASEIKPNSTKCATFESNFKVYFFSCLWIIHVENSLCSSFNCHTLDMCARLDTIVWLQSYEYLVCILKIDNRTCKDILKYDDTLTVETHTIDPCYWCVRIVWVDV